MKKVLQPRGLVKSKAGIFGYHIGGLSADCSLFISSL